MVKFNFDPTLFGHSFFITLIVGFSIIAICEYIGVLWYGFRQTIKGVKQRIYEEPKETVF